MTYKLITSKTSPNQMPRKGKISSITIHWWDRPKGQKIDGIVSWLCSPKARASAHFVVTKGLIYRLVHPSKAAWHAGNIQGNHTSIGIELDPNPDRNAVMLTAADLIRDIRREYGDLPLYPHNKWVATECPGDFDLAKLDKLARSPIPTKPIPAPVNRPKKPVKLKEDGTFGRASVRELQSRLGVSIDGYAGPITVKALQKKLDCIPDGYFSNQRKNLREAYTGFNDEVLKFSNSGGSLAVATLQRRIGVYNDGVWGHITSRELQRKLNLDNNFLRW